MVSALVTVILGVKIDTWPTALNVEPQDPFCNLTRYNLFFVTLVYAKDVVVLVTSTHTTPLSSEYCHFWIVPVCPERVSVPELVVDVCEAFDTEPPTGGVPAWTVTVMGSELVVVPQVLVTTAL